MKKMIKVFRGIIIYTLMVSCVFSLITGCARTGDEENTGSDAAAYKNVIMMVPDGTSVETMTLARWCKNESLILDSYVKGLVRTYCADGMMTDSAAGATAMATGHKTHSGYIGVLPINADMPGEIQPDENRKKAPVATVLEGAKLQGKSTGIFVTSSLAHATPSAFSAHFADRGNTYNLAEQMIYNDIDVILSGGMNVLTAEGREDGEDLLSEAGERGYRVIEDRASLMSAEDDKLLGIFAENDLKFDIDKPESQPSLAEMTAKGLELLSQNEKGFFALIEGSAIDWGNHYHDPVAVKSEALAFDEAFGAALEFAQNDGDTLILVAADHGTGGMTIGSKATDGNYSVITPEQGLGIIIDAELTGAGVADKLNKKRTNIEKLMDEYYNIGYLSNEEIESVKIAEEGSATQKAIGEIISARTCIGWTTGGHTGDDVVLYAFDPKNIVPSGVIQNTDIAGTMETAMGLNLEEVTDRLYVNVEEAVSSSDIEMSVNEEDVYNPVLELKKGSDLIELPQNKDYMLINGSKIELEGVTCYDGSKWFVGQKAFAEISGLT